jgi:hypothetical protein
MPNPVRLNPELIAAAERAGLVQKRSVPKQIEFWATIGKAVENIIEYSDIFAILQGLKKITIEPVTPVAASPEDVFASLDMRRSSGELAENVTEAEIYYEASKSHAGMLDRVNAMTGERCAGHFSNGEFEALQG